MNKIKIFYSDNELEKFVNDNENIEAFSVSTSAYSFKNPLGNENGIQMILTYKELEPAKPAKTIEDLGYKLDYDSEEVRRYIKIKGDYKYTIAFNSSYRVWRHYRNTLFVHDIIAWGTDKELHKAIAYEMERLGWK